MAISRGAGTEIIRSASFYDLAAATNTKLIIGVQHHIYTVLSVIIYSRASYTPFNVELHLTGYDSDNGTSAQDMRIFKNSIQTEETFVWNDKFSFNGYEPVDFSGAMDSSADQDAIADQGSSVAQYLWLETGSASDALNCFITYIDQNNA